MSHGLQWLPCRPPQKFTPTVTHVLLVHVTFPHDQLVPGFCGGPHSSLLAPDSNGQD